MEPISVQIDPVYWQIGLPALGLGLAFGGLIGWLSARPGRRRLEDDLARLEREMKDEAALQMERDSAFEAASSRLASEFSMLAHRSLRTNSETFLRLAEQSLKVQQEKAKSELGSREQAIENLVKPIRDALRQSQEQIHALEKARSEAYGGIRAQLETMQHNQAVLARETQNLVNALRRPEVRGRWGEITLKRLVELAGMVEHCDFKEQVQVESDEQAFRPDMIIRMPDRRELVVDVKTPLDAYLEAAEAPDDEARKVGLRRHARTVKDHVRKLSGKAYWQQFETSPEFVILFIPGDQFLSAALNEDPELIEHALAQQIILATPTSFIALLKAVAYGWRQVALAENAGEIRKLAEDLYGRLGVFVSHMNKVGRQLGSSVENYNRAVASLERKVLPGARRFADLGIHPKKELAGLETLESVPRSLTEPGDDDRPQPPVNDDEAVQ